MANPAPHRVDRSETTIAHELFGALWGVLFLGAVDLALPVSLPIRIGLGEYVEQRKAGLDEMLARLQTVGGLSDPSMALYNEERANWPTVLADADEIAGRLLLYSRNLGEWPVDLRDDALLRRLVTHGVDCQLRSLIDAMILAVALRQPLDPTLLATLHDAAVEAAQLGGAPSPRTTARRAYEAWRIADLGNILEPNSRATDAARAALRRVVALLDPLF